MKTFGVYLHSSGTQGGYVVRTMRDGTAAAPYLHVRPVHTYKREYLAQLMADKLNLDRFGKVA
jgi:hypothetical protein